MNRDIFLYWIINSLFENIFFSMVLNFNNYLLHCHKVFEYIYKY